MMIKKVKTNKNKLSEKWKNNLTIANTLWAEHYGFQTAHWCASMCQSLQKSACGFAGELLDLTMTMNNAGKLAGTNMTE